MKEIGVMTKLAVLAGGSAIVCGLIKYYYMKFSKDICESEATTAINDVLLYGSEQASEKKKASGAENLYTIIYVMNNAKHSLDVCVPGLSSTTINYSLMFSAKNGIKVRLIIHKDRNTQVTVQLDTLKQLMGSGILVKIIELENVHEHEFVLVDTMEGSKSEPIVLVGSLNYSYDSVNTMYDHTMVTSEPAIIQKLQKEFNRLWNAYNPDCTDV